MKKQIKKKQKYKNPLSRMNDELIEKKQYGRFKQSTIALTAKNGKNDIDKHEVESIYKQLENFAETQKGKKISTVIRGVNCTRTWTLKKLKGKLDILDFEEYWARSGVKDKTKFEKFEAIFITVIVEDLNFEKPQFPKNVFKKK